MKRRLIHAEPMLWALVCLGLAGCQGGGGSNPVGPCHARISPPPLEETQSVGSPFVIAPTEVANLEMECIAIEDLDGDGHADVVVARTSIDSEEGLLGHLVILWGQEGRGFTQTVHAFPPGATPVSGCTVVDLDRDGRLDVLAGTGEGNVAALVAIGDRDYLAVTDLLQLPAEANGLRPVTLVSLDLDGTPPLDLLVGTYGQPSLGCAGLDEDPGEGGDVSFDRPIAVQAQIHCFQGTGAAFLPAAAGLCPESLTEIPNGPVWAAHVADLNDDGRTDVIFSGDYGENQVLLSRPGGGLDLETDAAGIAVYNHAMGFALEDFDGDGLRDLYVSDTGPDQLWRGIGCGAFEDASHESQVAQSTDRGYGWGLAASDFDRDGDLDIFVTNSFVTGPGGWATEFLCKQIFPGNPPQSHFLLVNDGAGHFQNVQIALADPISLLRTPVTMAHGDLDRDGRMDVAVIENRRIVFYWNEGVQAGHWLSVVPRDAPKRPAVGARVVVRGADGRPRWRDVYGTHGRDGHSELVAYFGLGSDTGPLTVDIRWPDGEWTRNEDVEVDQRVVLTR